LKAIWYEQLYSNRESEILLLVRCSNTESIEVIRMVLGVYAAKLSDRYIDKKDLRILQKQSLKLIKKWHQQLAENNT